MTNPNMLQPRNPQFTACPSCGRSTYDPEIDYCGACGHEVVKTELCTNCLEEIEDASWRYCPWCGSEV